MPENAELLGTDLSELMVEYEMFKRGYEQEVDYSGGLAGGWLESKALYVITIRTMYEL